MFQSTETMFQVLRNYLSVFPQCLLVIFRKCRNLIFTSFFNHVAVFVGCNYVELGWSEINRQISHEVICFTSSKWSERIDSFSRLMIKWLTCALNILSNMKLTRTIKIVPKMLPLVKCCCFRLLMSTYPLAKSAHAQEICN